MRLAAGTWVGPYEVVALLGAGGMAEVYRARDSRLQREVALKVVGAKLSANDGFLGRLEQEARLAGSLNHPNIVSVHDVGSHDGSPYIVTELLEGETLRERLSKGLVPLSSALDWGVQMAEGLSAAHGHGIVHRDLKPENVFLTRSGQIKLLDFGIAKLSAAVTEPRGLLEQTVSPSGSATSTGVVFGTPAYMSPEQVRGEPVDARSDIFSLGGILYELLSGQRPFHSGSSVETGYAILHQDPPPLPAPIPRAIGQLVYRCLAKDADQRFQSARDLAFSLEALRTASGPTAPLLRHGTSLRSRQSMRRLLWPAVALLVALLAFFGGRSFRPVPHQPTVRQVTFRRGSILGARFAPDGQTVHFSAAWAGGAPQIYSASVDSLEIRSHDVGFAQLLSVSQQGELAVSLRPTLLMAFDNARGTLARVPPLGGAPREIATDVEYADWAPDGERLAIARFEDGRSRLEFPVGKVRFESTGWISHPRVSPSRDQVAFVNHPLPGDSAGEVLVLGPAGQPEVWTERFAELIGLAWRPGGEELLFTGGRSTEVDALWAVGRGRPPHLVYRSTGSLLLNDVSRDGRVLVTQRDWRQELNVFRPGDKTPMSLEWLDWPAVAGVTDDGSVVLSFESGVAVGGQGLILLQNLAQPAPVKLGLGHALDLSPDGKWALATRDPRKRLWLLPTGPGAPRTVDVPGVERIESGGFFRDGKRVALLAQPSGSAPGVEVLYVFELEGAKLRAISPPLTYDFLVAVSPDQRWVATSGPDRVITAYPVEGGEPIRATELGPAYHLAGWLQDGSFLAFKEFAFPAEVRRYDPRTRESSLFTTLAPADSTAVPRILKVRVTPDGRTLAFHFPRMSGSLYVLDWGTAPP